MTEPNELRWHPADDGAFIEGQLFVERHLDTADEHLMWHGWMVRQAFWCGVKWAREHRSRCGLGAPIPVAGRVVDDGRIEWNAGD